VRLYGLTDDPGMKDMLQFLIARDTMHQNQWLAVIEELGGVQGVHPIPGAEVVHRQREARRPVRAVDGQRLLQHDVGLAGQPPLRHEAGEGGACTASARGLQGVWLRMRSHRRTFLLVRKCRRKIF
jgi:hypothetical protein